MSSGDSTRTLGATGPSVPPLGLGGAWVQPIPDAQAMGAVDAAWDAGTRYFDTAPWYGKGLSEQRMGMSLHVRPRDDYQLSTKVGRFLRPVGAEELEEHGWPDNSLLFNVEFDYRYEAIQQQHRESLQRLGCGRVDALVIHDMEQSSETVPGANPRGLTVEQHYEDLASGGFRALQALRASGAIAAFGAGVNADEGELKGTPFGATSMREFNQQYCRRLADLSTEDPINFFLMANIYSLLDFTAHTDGLLDLCAERGISVVVGGPFASGILAGDPTEGTYVYGDAPSEVVQRAIAIQKICDEHGVALGAAALQFPLGHRAVSCVIPGARSAEEAAQCAEWMAAEIPPALWAALKQAGHIPAGVSTPIALTAAANASL